MRGRRCETQWFLAKPLTESGKDLGDATMGDPELPGDVTRSDPLMGKLYNPLTNHVGERTTVHKHPAKLVHASMTCNAKGE